MTFEYLVSAPQSVMVFHAILLMITSVLGSGFLALWSVGLWAVDDIEFGKYKVFNADGEFICVTDFDGAVNVCEALESNKH